MISLAGENSADELPDPLSTTRREAKIGSSCTGGMSTTGSSEAKMVADTSRAVAVVAASTATEVAANLTSSGPRSRLELYCLLG